MRDPMNKIECFCYNHPYFGIKNLMLYITIANVAFWVLSDFVWLGTLLFAIRSMAESLLGPKWARRSPVLAALLAVPGALFLFPDDFSARSLGTGLVPAGQIVLAFGLPFLALLCRWLREKGGGKGPPMA